MVDQLELWLQDLARCFPEGSMYSHAFMLTALLALVLISIVCGSVGSLVVGNRMAFFSDALAHCAFAGVALGLLIGLLTNSSDQEFQDFLPWVTVIMVVFGSLLGLGIAFVRERTAQANDTVIGVFFAGAIGLGAVLLKAGSARRYMPPEDFLFGNIIMLTAVDLLELLGLTVLVACYLAWMYNRVVFTSFNVSLARSRGIQVRMCNYLFIILLAIVVNLCLKIVGALLINALLVVPAATAANLSRDLRQLFRWSIGICIFISITGLWLSWELELPNPGNPSQPIKLGESGMIVVLGVVLYFVSMLAPVRSWATRPIKS